MDYIDTLKQRLEGAGRYAQIAMAAECANRVYPIYEAYWVGDFDESVKQSIDLGWSFAQGNKIDKNLLQSYLNEVQDIVDFYNEDGISELASTITVVLRMLEAISGNEEDTKMAIARALVSTQASATYTEAMVNKLMPIEPNEEIAADYEEAWQGSALKIVEGWSDYATKEMFAPIREEGFPPWLKSCFDRYKPSKVG